MHVVAATSLAYKPFSLLHNVHAGEPDVDAKEPLLHGWHFPSLDFSGDDFPAGHFGQFSDGGLVPVVPAGHASELLQRPSSVQSVARKPSEIVTSVDPSPPTIFPSAGKVQFHPPVLFCNHPRGQPLHSTEASNSAYLPGIHLVHAVDSIPSFV